MKFKTYFSEKERIKNFERISYKNDVINVLATHYANARNLNIEETIAGIKKACARFFKAKYNRGIL
jgi:hypothetical protein